MPFIALFIVHMFWYCNIWHFMVLFAYNLIAGMSKSLWYARTIPFWYFYPFLSYPVNPPQGSFFVCDTVWENSGHLTRREVRHPSVPLTPFSMSHGYPIPKMRILRQGGGGGRGRGRAYRPRAPLLPCSAIDRQHQIPQLFPPTVAKDAVLLIVANILGRSKFALHATLRSVSIKSPLWCFPLITRAFRRPQSPVSDYG